MIIFAVPKQNWSCDRTFVADISDCSALMATRDTVPLATTVRPRVYQHIPLVLLGSIARAVLARARPVPRGPFRHLKRRVRARHGELSRGAELYRTTSLS